MKQNLININILNILLKINIKLVINGKNGLFMRIKKIFVKYVFYFLFLVN